MKNRIFKSLTAIFLLICMVFSLFGCGGQDSICDHKWEIAERLTATCQREGKIVTKCSLCGETNTTVLSITDHAKSNSMSYDETHHWYRCLTCKEQLEAAKHDVDYTDIHSGNTNHWYGCSVCNAPCETEKHKVTSYNIYNKNYHSGTCAICKHTLTERHDFDTTNTCLTCGFIKTEPKEKIVIWVSEVEGATELAQAQVNRFLADNPEYGYTIDDFVIEGVYEPDTASQVLCDLASAPDIYCFAQDQINRLVQASALLAPGKNAAANIAANNDSVSVAAGSVGGTLYAYPMTSDNGYYLYYDKSIITDPTSLEAIVAACENAGKKFAFELENAWYTASFFIGAGCESKWETDVDGNFISIKDNWDSDKGVIAMKGMQILTHSEAYYNDSSDFYSSAAVVTGIWNANVAEEAYGENLGVCKLPTFTVDGETYQLGSFSGNKLMGVKPQRDTERAEFCSALAQYLTGEECQLERYDMFQWGPSNKNAQATDEVKSNPSLVALHEQSQYAIPQGFIHGDWWNIAKLLGSASIFAASDAEIKTALEQYRAAIDALFSK